MSNVCCSGIGRETAATLVRRNAHGQLCTYSTNHAHQHPLGIRERVNDHELLAVILACRSAERGEKLRKELYEEGVRAGRKPSLEASLPLEIINGIWAAKTVVDT